MSVSNSPTVILSTGYRNGRDFNTRIKGIPHYLSLREAKQIEMEAKENASLLVTSLLFVIVHIFHYYSY